MLNSTAMRFSSSRRYVANSPAFANHLQIFAVAIFLSTAISAPLQAQSSAASAWLGYPRLEPALAENYEAVPHEVVRLGNSAVLVSAEQELVRGLSLLSGAEIQTAT